jgi:hypothetical protein
MNEALSDSVNMSLADDSIAQRSERKGFRNELDMERAMGIDQIQPTKIKALLPASWFNWSQIGVNSCCCEVTDRRQAAQPMCALRSLRRQRV